MRSALVQFHGKLGCADSCLCSDCLFLKGARMLIWQLFWLSLLYQLPSLLLALEFCCK
jgi:hypothetical protein